ncbi:M20 family metallopeptidase [Enterococcus hulanensis]|uniref:M20 family metallopeptidase n=1 Tax=Enterococcus hulanensis TaxID=2559929 RepID=A0ABU3EVA7_9ENTE|nr:M20 family metallopeptidase [Enterococcus hulanensis]MDT2598263.1 M20 family metallopeptidase [Enterococcus hulanensis]MDT2608232.1 M20 family metallopeptidase [Enterococcus hulanensis]MDT2615527.1 M20 family metallopeptidase [Enterococcus hulanensis]MDT2626502.1 M20 family metallopeptidase [Enterococcus hulanensis]MDT2654599.1 M20 family metallopeptidase [Enterococcus hulanensis]
MNKETSMQQELVEIRRHLHQNPEVGMDLPATKKFVWQKLVEYGYEPQACGEMGITCTIGQGERVFLLRGDMDALPLTEDNDLPFRSVNGAMHACGHDMHTTMLLGAAKILKERESELKGIVKLLFQPGEEILQGAKDCIDAGVLENPKVDAGAMIHVFPFKDLPLGNVFVAPAGTFMVSADWFEIKVQGVGSHGSMPEVSIDPINVATKIYDALQTLSAREISSAERFVLTIGEFVGGTPGSSNVIPNSAFMKGTLRTLKEEVRQQIKKRMVEISEAIGQAFGAKVTIDFTNGCCSNEIDQAVTETVKAGLENVFPSNVLGKAPLALPMMGSEDFGEISHRIPTTTMFITVADTELMLHNPKIVFDESVLNFGSNVYVEAALAYFESV